MTYTLSLLAAVAFAFGTVLQQRGNLATPSEENDPHFLVEIVRKPIWLIGLLCQIAGWILQAVALDRGPLVVVQCLVVTSLVVALPLGIWLTNQQIGAREWIGAFMVLAGLMAFLWAGAPSGGTAHPSAGAWWWACLATLALVAVFGALGWRLRGARKALLLGTAAGFAFGLQATVTKDFVGELSYGVLSVLAHWPVYVLILSALVGFVLTQGSLKSGVLAPAVASSNAITLFSSVVLGIAVYGEKLSGSANHHKVSAILGLALALAGVALLGGSRDPTPARVARSSPDLTPAS